MSADQAQPEAFSSLAQVLHQHAMNHPDKLAYQYLENGTELGDNLSYAQLNQRARSIASRLGNEVSPGDRVILIYPAGLDFLEGFFGCLYAGVIPIPAPTPDVVHFKRSLPRLQSIIKDAAGSLILTNRKFEPQLQTILDRTELVNASVLATDWVEGKETTFCLSSSTEPQDLAYLQYTSGSISVPKGVMISHGNLMVHLRDMAAVYHYSPSTRSLNWMPHHHDYGLVQGLLLSIYVGASCYVMSPSSFIRKPLRWLQAISVFKINHSQGSAFAYAYCLRKFDPGKITGLDLSCWNTASVGAEPINPDIMQRFQRTFLPFGFNPSVLVPAYGLAEATLVVSTRRPGSGLHLGHFAARSLMKNRVVESDNQVQRILVGCGQVVSENTRLRIVNPETHYCCQPNEIGEIWVAGPGIAQGYWNRPEETKQVFQAKLINSEEGPFLRTGDLGFLKDGELFIAGRCKDLIIIRGLNHYPKDIEFAAEASHPKLRIGRCAAFSIEAAISDQLVVVAEFIGAGDEALYQTVVGAINEAVTLAAELTPSAIVLIRTGGLPVTSSGKIQRQACRKLYAAGQLDVVYQHRNNDDDETFDRSGNVNDFVDRQLLIEQLTTTPNQVDDKVLRTYLVSVLAEAMKMGDLDWLKGDQNLLELGVDSMISVEFRAFLEDELTLSLPINLLVQCSTLDLLSIFIKEQLQLKQLVPSRVTPGCDNATNTIRSVYTAKDKQQMLDWSVQDTDLAYDLTTKDILSCNQLNLPLDKVRMRNGGTQIITDNWKPSVPFIHHDSKVLGMGSCFTRDIMLWLAECGFNRNFPGSPYNALLRYPAIGNNAYLAEQFRIMGYLSNVGKKDCWGIKSPSRFLDAEQDEGRQLFQLLQDMDVLLLTLGSVEAWSDIRTGTVLKAPMLLSEYDPRWHRFQVDSFADTLSHLETVDLVLREHFPTLKIIFTLPLGRMATYRPLSALSAACAQEATLHTALGEFLESRAGDSRLHYFPAYELFTQFFVDPYQVDNIHATPYVTGRLCASFSEMFCQDVPQSPASDSLENYDSYHSQAIAFSLEEGNGAKAAELELQSKISALETENAFLKETCDERLVVIEELDLAFKERHGKNKSLHLLQRLGALLRNRSQGSEII